MVTEVVDRWDAARGQVVYPSTPMPDVQASQRRRGQEGVPDEGLRQVPRRRRPRHDGLERGHRCLGQPDQGGRPDLGDAPRGHRAAGHLPAHRRGDQRHADALVPGHAQGRAGRRSGTSSPTCSTSPTSAATGTMPDSGILEDGLLKTLPGVKPGCLGAGADARAEHDGHGTPSRGRAAPPRGGPLKRMPHRVPRAHCVTSLARSRGVRWQWTSRPSSRNWKRLKSQVERLENEIATARSGPGLAGHGLLLGLLRDGGLPAGQPGRDRQPAVQRDRCPARRQEPARADPRLPDLPPGREGPRSSPRDRTPMPSTTG